MVRTMHRLSEGMVDPWNGGGGIKVEVEVKFINSSIPLFRAKIQKQGAKNV